MKCDYIGFGGAVMDKIDCSKCINCYPHEFIWGEFWCKEKEKTSKDGFVYDLHNLKGRFKEECLTFKNKNMK